MLLTGIVAIALYACAFALQLAVFRRGQPTGGRSFLLSVSALAVAFHAATSWRQTFTASGVDFGLLPVSSTIFLAINLIVVLSSIKKPLHNLLLLLFPATVGILALTLLPGQTGRPHTQLSLGISIHILLSLLAYSLMTIAALQALLLAWQNRQLHQHHLGDALRALPPLQTMEILLFEILGAGFFLLTLALVAGFLFVDDFLAQHIAHKTVFSVLAWLVYATLLWGRYRLGWRGKRAIHWTLGGFTALMLAFWGTKFVVEVILDR